LDELKQMGVKLAIDHFGTGCSSLGYLLELPIDVLKVDKTFVTGISTSWRRHALVEGIVRLARTLEAEMIADGIETETERELLAGMGCQFGQGYVIEGACRHLIADRLSISGSRWGLDGAEAVLTLRAVISNGDFTEYWRYHLAREHQRLYPGTAQGRYALGA
jgi:EAL domain-containing protein (putative c-di-GMP-specific phosphodiesterase class I)